MGAKEQKRENTFSENSSQEKKEQKVLVEEKSMPEKEFKKNPIHNSLQHDPKVSMPLLSLLVEALKKENKEETKKKGEESEEDQSLEGIAETEEGRTENDGSEEGTESEKKKKWKDPVVALAERIKQFYANELMQQAYTEAGKNYHANAQYNNDRMAAMQGMIKATVAEEGYSLSASEQKKLPKAIVNENSDGYKLSGGSKLQKFIMTHPTGKLRSSWTYVRILNETDDGKIERNDGYIPQGLS